MAVVLVLLALALGADWRPVTLRVRTRPRRLTSIQRTNAEARFLAGLASELRAGAALRGAFAAAADRAPELDLGPLVRLGSAGAPLADLGVELAGRLAHNGPAVAAALRVAAETGGRTAAMFESLAQVAAEDRVLHRELRAATAQAKVSSLVVGGMPVLFLVWQALTGRLGTLASSAIGVSILVIGLGLLGSGALSVGIMLRSATR